MRFVARGATAAPISHVELTLPGVHNVRNALAAIAVGREVGVPDAAIAKALAEFTRRRPALPALRRGARSPAAARSRWSTTTAITRSRWRRRSPPRAASFPGRRLVLAFQPHRYTRTRDLFEDFVRVLSTADALVLADVYPAGEAPIVAADGRALARAVRVAGKVEPVFVEAIAELPATLRDARARRRRGA